MNAELFPWPSRPSMHARVKDRGVAGVEDSGGMVSLWTMGG